MYLWDTQLPFHAADAKPADPKEAVAADVPSLTYASYAPTCTPAHASPLHVFCLAHASLGRLGGDPDGPAPRPPPPFVVPVVHISLEGHTDIAPFALSIARKSFHVISGGVCAAHLCTPSAKGLVGVDRRPVSG